VLAMRLHSSAAKCEPVGAPEGTEAPAPISKVVFDGLIAPDKALIEIGMLRPRSKIENATQFGYVFTPSFGSQDARDEPETWMGKSWQRPIRGRPNLQSPSRQRRFAPRSSRQKKRTAPKTAIC